MIIIWKHISPTENTNYESFLHVYGYISEIIYKYIFMHIEIKIYKKYIKKKLFDKCT